MIDLEPTITKLVEKDVVDYNTPTAFLEQRERELRSRLDYYSKGMSPTTNSILIANDNTSNYNNNKIERVVVEDIDSDQQEDGQVVQPQRKSYRYADENDNSNTNSATPRRREMTKNNSNISNSNNVNPILTPRQQIEQLKHQEQRYIAQLAKTTPITASKNTSNRNPPNNNDYTPNTTSQNTPNTKRPNSSSNNNNQMKSVEDEGNTLKGFLVASSYSKGNTNSNNTINTPPSHKSMRSSSHNRRDSLGKQMDYENLPFSSGLQHQQLQNEQLMIISPSLQVCVF